MVMPGNFREWNLHFRNEPFDETRHQTKVCEISSCLLSVTLKLLQAAILEKVMSNQNRISPFTIDFDWTSPFTIDFARRVVTP